jgi:hypothetical protein
MNELIFFGIIILFSILDSVLKKQKKKAEESGRLAAPEESSPEPRPEPRVEREALGVPQDMVPADVWAEIAELARGGRPQERWSQGGAPTYVPAPVPPSTLPEPTPARVGRDTGRARGRPEPVGRGSRAVTMPGEAVHQTHRDYGTDPSKRAASEQDGLDPLAESLSADAREVRGMLSSGSGHRLRQAFILHELLGAPAAMKSDDL